MEYDYLWEYFDEYKITKKKSKKMQIEKDFIDYIYSGDAFILKKSREILFEDLYEKKFNITTEQKNLFIKWCVHKMFENYLDEEELEERAIERGYKDVSEVDFRFLFSHNVLDYRIEDYFCQTVFLNFYKKGKHFNNNNYFQCKNCGGLFLKPKNRNKNKQKYCLDCKKIVKNIQNCGYKRKK